MDSNPHQIGFFSKYCKGILSPNIINEEKYLKFLIKIGIKLKNKCVLYPLEDSIVLFILKNENILNKYFKIPLSEKKISLELLNKRNLFKILHKYKIPHPKTLYIRNKYELHENVKNINFPCLIKPFYSHNFKQIFYKKLFKIRSKRELIHFYSKFYKKFDIIIQELIPGNATNLYGLNTYYDEKSISHGHFNFRKIRQWPKDFGTGTCIEMVYEPKLINIIDPLIKDIRFHGIIDVEFKWDCRDSLFKLIDINIRPWLQNSFPSEFNNNIIYLSYLDKLGKKVELSLSKKTYDNLKWINIFCDFLSFFYSQNKDKYSISKYFRDIYGKKIFSLYAKDDPIPFILAPTNLNKFYFKHYTTHN